MFVNIIVVGVYIQSGSPEHVVLGDNVIVTLTCVVDDNYKLVTWSKDSIYVGSIRNECELGNGADTACNYTCDVDNNVYHLVIPPDVISEGIQCVVWRCLPVVGTGSNGWSLALSGTCLVYLVVLIKIKVLKKYCRSITK
jgi:hypothetical protein